MEEQARLTMYNAKTGEKIEKLDSTMIGLKVVVETAEGKSEDWITEVWCPVCEAHHIGTIASCGGFLARHGALHGHEAQVITQQ